MNAQEFILKEKTKDKLYEGHPTDKDYWTDSDMVFFAERYYNTKIGINIDKKFTDFNNDWFDFKK
jgi:hypothetical protein